MLQSLIEAHRAAWLVWIANPIADGDCPQFRAVWETIYVLDDFCKEHDLDPIEAANTARGTL